MKKFMLCAGFMTIACNPLYAENNSKEAIKADIISTQDVPTPTTPEVPAPAPGGEPIPVPQGSSTPSPAPGTAIPEDKPIPASGTKTNDMQNSTTTQTPSQPATSTITTVATQPPQPIDCNYHIPAETTQIEQSLVMQWAQKAATQSFNFDHRSIDDQLTKLKACYTDQGWQGFNDALQKSGNLSAIKSQQLTVSSTVNGEPKINEVKENQWKISLPLEVNYQNAQEKLTQQLTINLLIGRKINGDLGIMQMIATTQQTTQGDQTTSSPK